MDIVRTAVGGLSHSTDKYTTHPYACVDDHPDAPPAYRDCYANANPYAHPFSYWDTGTAWLSKTAGGVYTGRDQRLDH